MDNRVILVNNGLPVAVRIVGKVGHGINKNYCIV
jgi:hypothetical protein